jgi:hypothetical protein
MSHGVKSRGGRALGRELFAVASPDFKQTQIHHQVRVIQSAAAASSFFCSCCHRQRGVPLHSCPPKEFFLLLSEETIAPNTCKRFVSFVTEFQ